MLWCWLHTYLHSWPLCAEQEGSKIASSSEVSRCHSTRSCPPAEPAQFDDTKELKDIGCEKNERSCSRPTGGRVTADKNREKTRRGLSTAPSSLCRPREKTGGVPTAPHEKTSAHEKPVIPLGLRERTGGNAVTCTVNPSPAQTADRSRIAAPSYSPKDQAKSVDTSSRSHLARRESKQPAPVAHAGFGETEPKGSWSENVAALTSAAWAWLSRALQAACCYSCKPRCPPHPTSGSCMLRPFQRRCRRRRYPAA